MKKVRDFTCWTDYPFAGLGDPSGKIAPVRHVRVLRYGYVGIWATVECLETGVYEDVKAGYLYSKPGRLGQVAAVNIRKLERMIENPKFIDEPLSAEDLKTLLGETDVPL